MFSRFTNKEESPSGAGSFSRRKFFKGGLITAGALVLGLVGDKLGENYEYRKIIDQLHSGRLFFVTPEILSKHFDAEIVNDERFQWFTTLEGEKQLRCDMLHFARTDQASQLYEKLSALRDNVSVLKIDEGESIRLPLLGKQASRISGTIQVVGDVEQQTINNLYDCIVMNLRDQVESWQYSDPIARKYLATAGVATDINANLLSMHMGKNPELIQYIISHFGKCDEKYGEIRTNFRGREELESIYGKNMYFGSGTPSPEFLHYLRANQSLTPKDIGKENFPGLNIELST